MAEKYKILIVEDEYIIAVDIQNMLHSHGKYSADIVMSGQDALGAVGKDLPDLILMDIVLPLPMDGIETADRIKKDFDVPVIFLTSHSDDATVMKAKSTGPHGYLLKPINEPDLFTAIEIAIHKHGIDRRLKESEEKYRELAHHLQTLREEERSRISREIHDELGQTMTALRMDLFWLQENSPGLGADVKKKISSMTGLVDDTIEKVRTISSYLRPGILDDLGLCPAVEWLVGETRQRTGIEFEVTMPPGDMDVDPELSTDIFRIIQEALTNIARHSKADRVKILLGEDTSRLNLTVSDNGFGISSGLADDPRSFGLIGIRERASFHGGEARIEGFPGKGTVVSAWMPKKRKRADQ